MALVGDPLMTRTSTVSKFPVFRHPRPIALAHRGGNETAPENTMVAFEQAVGLGLRFIETDVQVTRDGIAVIFHDDDLQRLADRPGRVADHGSAELNGLRILGREPIPHLEELLGAWDDVRFVIEPKTDLAVEPLAEAIRRTGTIDRVCIGSFSGARIRRCREIMGPRLCTSLGPAGVTRMRLASLGLPAGGFVEGAAQVAVRHYGLPVVDRLFVEAAHRHGLEVQVWTVNEESEMDRLLDLGVDGLITDRPALLKSVLIRRGLWT